MTKKKDQDNERVEAVAKVEGLEPSPAVLETAALPVELHQRIARSHTEAV